MTRNTLFEFLRPFDNFGRGFALEYGKHKGHQTGVGIVFSMFKNLFLAFYFIYISIICIQRQNSNIVFNTVQRDFSNVTIKGQDVNFDIAFSLMYDANNTGGVQLEHAQDVGIDESYFQFQLAQLQDQNYDFSFVKEIPYYPCLEFEEKTGRVPFAKIDRAQFKKKLNKSWCVDSSNVSFSGDFLEGKGMFINLVQCKQQDDGPTCQYESTIETAASKIVFITFSQQNYFSQNNYTDPVQAEIDITSIAALQPHISQYQFNDVTYNSVELYDNRLQLQQNQPGQVINYSQVHRSEYFISPQKKFNGYDVVYSTGFFLTKEGDQLQRTVYTIFDLFSDYGGMSGACLTVITPLIKDYINRSFNYDLVTQHMKVKKRNSRNNQMPKQPQTYKSASFVVQLAGITRIDPEKHSYLSYICCPTFCSRIGNKNFPRLVKRGQKKLKKSLDILTLIRFQTRLKLIEQLLFNKGQLAMMALHKSRYLQAASSSSDDNDILECAPDSDQNFNESIQQTSLNLLGYQFRDEIDKRLWKDVILGPKETIQTPASRIEASEDNGSMKNSIEFLESGNRQKSQSFQFAKTPRWQEPSRNQNQRPQIVEPFKKY